MRLNDIASLPTRLLASTKAGLAAGRTRRALGELPDHILKDIGLTRGSVERFSR